MVDDNTLLLVGSALLIAAFFAMKDKDETEPAEGMEEDDDDFGKKKKANDNSDEQDLNEFSESPEGTVQTVLTKAQMLAKEAGGAEDSGVWPLSHGMRERVSRMQDTLNETIAEYDRRIEKVTYATYQPAENFTSRSSYRDLNTFREVMHAATVSSDAFRQAMEHRANVVNYVKQDFHKYEMQQNDNRRVQFNQQTAFVDQRTYDKRQYLSKAQTDNYYSQQNTYVDEKNLTFAQIQPPAPSSRSTSSPPDLTIPGRPAPRLPAPMEQRQIAIRNQVQSQPHDNVKPLAIEYPAPIAENRVIVVEDGFDKVVAQGTDKRIDPKTDQIRTSQDILTSGDKREASVVEFDNPRATKRKGIAAEQLFDSAPARDMNVAGSAPKQLMITNVAFNQLAKAPEVTPNTSEGGAVYLSELTKVFNRFKKVRNKFIDNESRVGCSAWEVLHCAPTGGSKGEVAIAHSTWSAKSPETWVELMQDGEGSAGGETAEFRRMLQRTKAGMQYRNKSHEVVAFMKKTYSAIHSLDTYLSMR